MWRVEFTADAARDLRRLDPQIAREILAYLRKRIATETIRAASENLYVEKSRDSGATGLVTIA